MISGIYKITCLENNKIYIGSSSNIPRRRNEHFWKLKKNIHPNPNLLNSYNKYGSNTFLFSIIEFCNTEILLEREQYYIDLLKPHFNCCNVAGTTLGFKHSEETILKMKLSKTGLKQSKETIAKRVNKIKGRIYTSSHRNNISLSKIGIKQNKEVIENRVSKSVKAVIQYDLLGNFIKSYRCAKDTRLDGFTPTNVTQCCKQKLKTHKKFIWKYE